MLNKIMGFQGRTTTLEEYKAALRRRVWAYLCLIPLGLLTLATTLLLMGGKISDMGDLAHLEGIWCGLGTGLIFFGAIYAWRTRTLLKDEARLRRSQLEEQDERNYAISSRALNLTAVTLLCVLYVAMLISSFINITVFYTLFACAVSGFVLLFVYRAVLSRSM